MCLCVCLCLHVFCGPYALCPFLVFELSLFEQMTNANVTAEHTGNTVIENTVNNQRKQNKHLGIKEDLHSLFGHSGPEVLFCFKTCVAMKFVDDDDDDIGSV